MQDPHATGGDVQKGVPFLVPLFKRFHRITTDPVRVLFSPKEVISKLFLPYVTTSQHPL